jgi:hypothetical protein
MSTNNNIDIKYLNKNYSSFKTDLIEYAKSYYPTTYTDFNQASPGSMFIEMASYVGDVLSFYLDNQLQETFLQYAKQKNNLYTLAYMLGYRPKVTSAAIADLSVYQQVPSIFTASVYIPDFTYAFCVEQGMQVKSNVDSSVLFYCPQKVDFRVSSSLDPTEVSVYTVDGSNNPTSFLLKKNTEAISGQVKTQTFSFGNAERFPTITLQDSNIISVLQAVDSNGNTWYEVPYLAQDYILNPVTNTSTQEKNQVPYMIQKIRTNRRFVTRFKSNETLEIEFGPGVNSVADSAIVPNPNSVSVGNANGGLSTLSSSFDPTNFVTTQTYGLAPKNTTITFTYLAGGGVASNVLQGQLTIPTSKNVTGTNTTFEYTLVTNNDNPASGGGDGDTVEELRLNSQLQFSSQLRTVTQEDYLARVLSMPPNFGKVSKAFVTKDDATFRNYLDGNPTQRDPLSISLYVLGLNNLGTLDVPTASLLKNIQTYLTEYRMMTDSINIKPAYVINIGCNFDIVIRPNYVGEDVVARCLIVLQDYFNTNNWQINQPIILADVNAVLDQVEGVQTVKKVDIVNKVGEIDGYSKYSYDISGATVNNVIYPSLDPSIFEVKFLTSDIQGRVVSF